MNISSEGRAHDPDKRIYHTDFTLVEDDTGELESIEGVDGVLRLGFYRVEVRKGRLFEWDDVDKDVVEMLTEIEADR